ncbi:tetratricopeptide repeat protein [Actinomadura xylanilytica]|uniref:tetratricopeptide repeat protein n=1 Tax=Actinomadura xylanilytica TaxID=887459 RepID=UPI00255B3A71|nr:tetratricopeptide repeat protein [Actinomadura xylanilytica]MDL4775245.1 tetratricopeptide repeat protein [Actinomadura xylanilytica]
MTDQPLLDSDGRSLPLPPDPLSPVPDEVEHGLAAYRAGDAAQARESLTAIAGTERTSVSGHAAMALAGIEIGENGLGGSYRRWLEQVAAGEDAWLGPLAAVILTPDFQSGTSSDPGRGLLSSLAAQLTGDLDTARDGFEHAFEAHKGTEPGDVAGLLLGNLLAQSGDQAAALTPLSYTRGMCDGTFAGYAAHLEGHVLIGQDEKERASTVLQYAHSESHPSRGGDKRLHPWVAVRFGELLASDPWVDLVYDQVEESGVSEGEVIREPFESAHSQREVSAPALTDIGFFLFPATFEPVHAGLERLKAWSDERYERGRRLVLTLHTHVEDGRDDERTQGLADLLAKLDLPKPKY